MKRYSISYPTFVNERASKTGVKFRCYGRTDDPDKEIERYKNSRIDMGLRIVDSLTKEVVFEELRPIRGELVLTLTNGKDIWTSSDKFVDLSYMREREHEYSYNKDYGKDYGYQIVKVERKIYQ